MSTEGLSIKITEIESRSKSNSRRLDEVEREQAAIMKLATAVEVLANEQKHQTIATDAIRTQVGKLDAKVESLEGIPAKRWETIMGVIVAGLVGFLLAQLGVV